MSDATANATCAEIDRHLGGTGLFVRGAFHPAPEDGVRALADGRAAATVVLVGNAGKDLWRAFRRDNPAFAGKHPLDNWVDAHLERAAAAVGAEIVFPTRRPWPPIQRWALKAGGVHQSPIGILIHPEYGLWHVYRGALLLGEKLLLPSPLPTPLRRRGEGPGMRGGLRAAGEAVPSPLSPPPQGARGISPCDSCAKKPCLTTCPADAFAPDRFDMHACVGHVESAAGKACATGGCLARRACPIGRRYAYDSEAGTFHMAAVVRTVRAMQAQAKAP